MTEEKRYLTESERERLTSLLIKVREVYPLMTEREKGKFEGALDAIEYQAMKRSA